VSTSVSGARYRHVTVTWTDNASGETGFSVERSFDGGGYSVVGTAAANATSYVDSNVTCGTAAYSYRLRAVFAGPTYSGYSAVSAITVECVPWVDVTSPPSSAVYHAGDTVWVQWEVNSVGLVYIDGTFDGGETYVQISTTGGISPSLPTWGNFPWVPVLPHGVESTAAAHVRVAEYTARATVFDISEAFTVYGAVATRQQAAATEFSVVSGLDRTGLVSLPSATPLVYTLKPGEQGVIRIFRPNGALVRSLVCTEPGTHAVLWDGARAGGPGVVSRGLYLVDMVVR
jgi:hypothetical protein